MNDEHEAELQAWVADQAERHGHDPEAIMAMFRESAAADWQINPDAKIDVWADDDVTIALPREHGPR